MNFDLSSFYSVKNILEEFTQINELSPLEDKVIKIHNADIVNILNHIILQTIKDIGINYSQGFLLGKPEPLNN